jgi:hypothetical protein
VKTTILAEALIANSRKSISPRCAFPSERRPHGAPAAAAPHRTVSPFQAKRCLTFGRLAHLSADRFLATMQARMRPALIASILAMFACGPAVAQMTTTTPAIGATSPPGMTGATFVPQTGIPMGATELPSAGLSPPLTGNGVACAASSSSGMSGSVSTYDGGGLTMGMPLPGSPTSGACGTGLTAGVASSSATSTTSAGPGSTAGIPLGSVEISNGGLSPLPVNPIPVNPIAVSPIQNPMPPVAGFSTSMAPATVPPMVSAPTTFAPLTGIGGVPCNTTSGSISSLTSSTGC